WPCAPSPESGAPSTRARVFSTWPRTFPPGPDAPPTVARAPSPGPRAPSPGSGAPSPGSGAPSLGAHASGTSGGVTERIHPLRSLLRCYAGYAPGAPCSGGDFPRGGAGTGGCSAPRGGARVRRGGGDDMGTVKVYRPTAVVDPPRANLALYAFAK